MKKRGFVNVIIVVAFLGIYSTAGAIECDKVGLIGGAEQIAVWAIVFVVGCILKR